jgi:ribosomal protein L30E
VNRGTAIRNDLESLAGRFQLVLKGYVEANTHDEKVKLVVVAKQIATEYRQQIAEYKRIIAGPV